MSPFWRLGIIASLASIPGRAWAQTPDSLHPGMRFRGVYTAKQRPTTGTLQDLTAVSLILVPGNTSTSVEIPLSDIRSLQASTGRHRPLLRGVLWGGLAGLALGAVLAVAFDGEYLDCVDSGGGAPVVIGFTTVIGSAFGLAVGSTIEKDRWRTVPLP